MDNKRPSASGRLVRVGLAVGILAGGLFIADAVLTTNPASAAAEIDLLPVGETPVSDLVDTVLSVAPVVAPVVASVSSVVDPLVSTVDATLAPLAPVTAPVLIPVRDITQPVVDAVVAPILGGVADALTPVVAPVVEGLVPVIETVVESAPVVASITASSGILVGESRPAISFALLGALAVGAASLVPTAPLAPAGRTPVSPGGVSPGGTTFLSDIFSWMPAVHGALAPASGAPPRPHASPVFASDITPD